VTDTAFYRWATASVLGASLITNAKPAGVVDVTAMLTMRNMLIYIDDLYSLEDDLQRRVPGMLSPGAGIGGIQRE
jgi:hypothetical protein